MKKNKLSVGGKSCLQNALEINEEMQTLLIPLLKKVENEVGVDTHSMLRTVLRLSICQNRDLDELNNDSE
ncbi:hypothetical protein [Xenorhabdus anantnagensis]|uniref:Uncharacterized protein n=1 Tax=Xenorhabdus anantnagensis TaxID=3025875 RepID=A0ABT5LQ03_9GAMM|nr:hypothetical protein [Xenorhabdus anantnagensis]MDC9596492.1 hypothetical protein [Xenorhabdus anantnagensis]MDC9597330.1 hypothetical protein [Xenorhabdus anantnagensis]